MSTFLALDQSTSGTKALLFAPDGRLLDRESREHRPSCPQPGWVEHDAEEIWRNSLETLRAVVRRQGAAAAEIAALSIANQRETVVVFERGGGRPLHPAIVWQCRRGDPLCAAQSAAGRAGAIRERTGLPLDAYFSASKLQWLVRNRPDLGRRLAAGEAVAGTIDAYLIHRLTAGAVFATDHTNASRTLLFDFRRLRWDEELCRWWEVPISALPEIRESFDGFGTTTLDGALPRPLPIRGVMGDSQASLLAHGCVAPGSAKATIGTGSSVLLQLGPVPRPSRRGLATALAWVHRGVPAYAFEGLIISAAATLAWLRDQLGVIADFGEIEGLVGTLEDNGGVYLVPAFGGLGLPHWRPDARAAIVGLSGHSDRRHLVRAALEAIAYQLHDALEAMRTDAALPLRRLHADGGPTGNRFLMQFVADVTGTELRAAAADCSALGAVRAGMLGLGLYESLTELAATPREERVYRPSMAPERVERCRAGWSRAVAQVLAPGPAGPIAAP
jgi:glycerol kinase